MDVMYEDLATEPETTQLSPDPSLPSTPTEEKSGEPSHAAPEGHGLRGGRLTNEDEWVRALEKLRKKGHDEAERGDKTVSGEERGAKSGKEGCDRDETEQRGKTVKGRESGRAKAVDGDVCDGVEMMDLDE